MSSVSDYGHDLHFGSTGGRLSLGLGAGAFWDAIEALGREIAPDVRARVADDRSSTERTTP